MDIVVFGTAGFVGQNLIDELAKTDHRVVACDIERVDHEASNVEYRNVDLTDVEAVSDVVSEAGAVAHLAPTLSPRAPSTRN